MRNTIQVSIRLVPFLVMASTICTLPLPAQTSHWVSAYYAGYCQAGSEDCDLPLDAVDFTAFTHIMHFAVLPDTGGTILWGPDINGMSEANMDALVDSAHAAGRKAILCIGGTNTNWRFRPAVDRHLSDLIKNLLTLMAARGYDGVDIDWEPLEDQDEERYRLFITVLRDSLNQRNPSLLLTAAVAWEPEIFGGDGVAPSIFVGIHDSLDQINLMTYDLMSVWGPWTDWASWHNTPIYDQGRHPLCYQWSTFSSVHSMVTDFVIAGVPKPKLAIGVDFYGYHWLGGVVEDPCDVPINDGIHAPELDWYEAWDWANFTRQVVGNTDTQWVTIDSVTIIRNGVAMSITPGKTIFVNDDNNTYDEYVDIEAVSADSIYGVFKFDHSTGTGDKIDVEMAPVVHENEPYWRILDEVVPSLYQPQHTWDEVTKAAYFSKDTAGYANDHFVSYDNQQTIRAKAQYVFQEGLGGTIVWELGGGYRHNLTGTQLKDSLLQEVKSAFITDPQVTLAVPVAQNWNLVSLPVSSPVPDDSVDHVFVNSIYPYAFAFSGGYVQRYTMANGPGYWVKSSQTYTQEITGAPRDSLSIAVSSGWNMIGSITPSIDTAQVVPTPSDLRGSDYFKYEGGYVRSPTIEPGVGYWVKANSAGRFFLAWNGSAQQSSTPCTTPPPSPAGEPAAATLVSPSDGATGVSITPTLSWNASSGADSYRLQVSASSGFGSTVFDQSGITTTSQQVGPLSYSTIYYWRVNATNDNGTSLWSCARKFTTQGIIPDGPDQFILSDAGGGRQPLFAQPVVDDIEMPPALPDGAFDARFQSGNFMEGIPGDRSLTHMPIVIQNATQPITFTWNINSENGTSYWIVPASALNDTLLWVSLAGSGSMVVSAVEGVISLAARTNRNFSKQSVADEISSSLPVSYALSQNYPNPFNPSTLIKYDLPSESRVSLKVFNILGQEVRTLVNEVQVAGYRSIEWDSRNNSGRVLASGVYFYRIDMVSTTDQGNSFSQVKKMLMLK